MGFILIATVLGATLGLLNGCSAPTRQGGSEADANGRTVTPNVTPTDTYQP
jgi:hypothetical protein